VVSPVGRTTAGTMQRRSRHTFDFNVPQKLQSSTKNGYRFTKVAPGL
jgi:hypothetical protein